ncbi:MAG: hypothetical protein HY319_31350 [Armatimonadetes bacterium]|nr:hypothetical protein [Armatimonadota bacterium]
MKQFLIVLGVALMLAGGIFFWKGLQLNMAAPVRKEATGNLGRTRDGNFTAEYEIDVSAPEDAQRYYWIGGFLVFFGFLAVGGATGTLQQLTSSQEFSRGGS